MMRRTERTMHIKASLINVMFMKIKYTQYRWAVRGCFDAAYESVLNNKMLKLAASGGKHRESRIRWVKILIPSALPGICSSLSMISVFHSGIVTVVLIASVSRIHALHPKQNHSNVMHSVDNNKNYMLYNFVMWCYEV